VKHKQEATFIPPGADEQAASKLAETVVMRFSSPKDFAKSALTITALERGESGSQSLATRLFANLYNTAHTLSQTEECAGFALYVRDEVSRSREEKFLVRHRAAYEKSVNELVEFLNPDNEPSAVVLTKLCSQIKAFRPLASLP